MTRSTFNSYHRKTLPWEETGIGSRESFCLVFQITFVFILIASGFFGQDWVKREREGDWFLMISSDFQKDFKLIFMLIWINVLVAISTATENIPGEF